MCVWRILKCLMRSRTHRLLLARLILTRNWVRSVGRVSFLLYFCAKQAAWSREHRCKYNCSWLCFVLMMMTCYMCCDARFAGEIHIFRQDWNFDMQRDAVSQMFSRWHQIWVNKWRCCWMILSFVFLWRVCACSVYLQSCICVPVIT